MTLITGFTAPQLMLWATVIARFFPLRAGVVPATHSQLIVEDFSARFHREGEKLVTSLACYSTDEEWAVIAGMLVNGIPDTVVFVSGMRQRPLDVQLWKARLDVCLRGESSKWSVWFRVTLEMCSNEPASQISEEERRRVFDYMLREDLTTVHTSLGCRAAHRMADLLAAHSTDEQWFTIERCLREVFPAHLRHAIDEAGKSRARLDWVVKTRAYMAGHRAYVDALIAKDPTSHARSN